MRLSFLALALALLCSCGGSTEIVGEPTTDASAGDATDSSIEATTDTTPSPDSQPEAASDAAPWETCFGVATSEEIKLCDSSGCIVKEHETDCCGNMQWMGVSADKASEFDTCEASWRDHLGVCNCPAGTPKTEQPATEVADQANVNVQCMDCTMNSCICMTLPK